MQVQDDEEASDDERNETQDEDRTNHDLGKEVEEGNVDDSENGAEPEAHPEGVVEVNEGALAVDLRHLLDFVCLTLVSGHAEEADAVWVNFVVLWTTSVS